jgi:hypothetical protein
MVEPAKSTSPQVRPRCSEIRILLKTAVRSSGRSLPLAFSSNAFTSSLNGMKPGRGFYERLSGHPRGDVQTQRCTVQKPESSWVNL